MTAPAAAPARTTAHSAPAATSPGAAPIPAVPDFSAIPSGVPAAVRLGLGPDASSAAGLQALIDVARQLDSLGVGALVLADDGESGLDALTVAGFLTTATTRTLIVPQVPITHSEPFHVATATATVDEDSQGRGGWAPVAQTSDTAARLTGRRDSASQDQAWAEVPVIKDAAWALWQSWESDAVIRDLPTGRFIDRERVNYVDFTGTDSVGEEFTIKGPSIVPRSPSGVLPTFIFADDEASAQAAALAADVAVVSDPAAAPQGPTVLVRVSAAQFLASTDAGKRDDEGASAEEGPAGHLVDLPGVQDAVDFVALVEARVNAGQQP